MSENKDKQVPISIPQVLSNKQNKSDKPDKDMKAIFEDIGRSSTPKPQPEQKQTK